MVGVFGLVPFKSAEKRKKHHIFPTKHPGNLQRQKIFCRGFGLQDLRRLRALLPPAGPRRRAAQGRGGEERGGANAGGANAGGGRSEVWGL